MKLSNTLSLLLLTTALGTIGQPAAAQPKKATDYPVTLRNAIRINTPAMEFAPVRYLDGIVYVTSRNKFGPRDERTGETFFELYRAKLDPDGMPIKPEPFSLTLNSPLHENAVTFNRKGDKIFFTRSNMDHGITRADAQGTVRMKIYEADRGPYDWTNIRELPFNSDSYSCIHPTLSPDESKLFFASDMPGGLGGFDIWFVVRNDDGAWSDPINMGAKVNTTKNEVFPFLHDSGTLFFSSDGYKGKGGLDIFMIDISANRWGEVQALDAPFNSPADDLSFSLDPPGRHGFFASDREGGLGKDDIYGFDAPAGIRGVGASIQPEPVAATIITVRDSATGRLLADADIRIFEKNSRGMVVAPGLIPIAQSPAEGSRGLAYEIQDESLLGAPKAITDRAGQGKLNLSPGQAYLLLISKPGYSPEQIHHPIGGKSVIDVILAPSQCMALTGTVLSDAGGQPLAGATVRIVNECTGEVSVLSSQLNGRFDYCLSSGCNFTLLTDKPGYQAVSTQISTIKIRGSRSMTVEMRLPAGNTAGEQTLHPGDVLVLEELYFASGATAIGSREADALEGLAQLMKDHPSLEIELGAHTDTRGSAEYNLKLSLRRAEAAKAFLVSRGIAANRIKAFGYGESKPRNHCLDGVDCSEEEHAYNRRTEVKITRVNEAITLPKPPPPAPATGEWQTKGK